MTKQHQTQAPPEHPFLMPESHYPIVHFDASQSDTTRFKYGDGDREVSEEQINFQPGGLGNGGLAHRIYDDSEAIITSGSARVAKYRFEDGRLDLVNEIMIPECTSCGREYQTAEGCQALVDALDHADTAKDENGIVEFESLTKQLVRSTGYTSATLANGMYTLLDRDGYFYAGYGTTIYKFGDEETNGEPATAESNIVFLEKHDLRGDLPEDIRDTVNRFLGINMTYDGHLVAALAGVIAVVDRETLTTRAFVSLPEESIDNGVVVDERNGSHGIYAVTSQYMRKLVWRDFRQDGRAILPDCVLSMDESDGLGAWKETYDGAIMDPDTSQGTSFSKGSGTTPTLMGFGPDADRLVLISDAKPPSEVGAAPSDEAREPRVKLVAYWRDEIPDRARLVKGAASKRVAGQAAVSFDLKTTIEWSPAVLDYGVMVTNGEFPNPVLVEGTKDEVDVLSSILSLGQTREAPKGVEKFVWNPEIQRFERGWRFVDKGLPWNFSPISSTEKVVYLHTVEDGVYKLVGLNWKNGDEIGSITLGKSVKFNSGGTFVSPQADGSLYVHGFFGPVRIAGVAPATP